MEEADRLDKISQTRRIGDPLVKEGFHRDDRHDSTYSFLRDGRVKAGRRLLHDWPTVGLFIIGQSWLGGQEESEIGLHYAPRGFLVLVVYLVGPGIEALGRNRRQALDSGILA